jgi:hypothetical protein
MLEGYGRGTVLNTNGRPSGARIAAIALLGPLVGTLAIFLLPFIIDPPAGGPSEPAAMVTVLLVFGYMFGILPSALAAFVYFLAAPRLTVFWGRLPACIFIGALCGALGVILPISIFAREIILDPAFMSLAAIAGAFALPLTALPFPPRP